MSYLIDKSASHQKPIVEISYSRIVEEEYTSQFFYRDDLWCPYCGKKGLFNRTVEYVCGDCGAEFGLDDKPDFCGKELFAELVKAQKELKFERFKCLRFGHRDPGML